MLAGKSTSWMHICTLRVILVSDGTFVILLWLVGIALDSLATLFATVP